MESKGRFGRALHHMYLIGLPGLAAGLFLAVYVPRLKPVANVIFLFAGFHLVGVVIVLASLYAMAGKRIVRHQAGRPHESSQAMNKFDFGWAPAMTIGPWTAALAAASGAVAVQVTAPALWPLSFLLVLLAAGFFAGYLIASSFKRPDYAALPMVNWLSGDSDLVLDGGCGAGRTTVSVGRILKKGSIVAVDRFDASYIKKGGRYLLEQNLRLAGLEDRVRIVQGDLTRLPFPDQMFGSAVSTHAVDHLGSQKEQGMREMLRVLKPGGRFLLVISVSGWTTLALANVLFFIVFFVTGKGEWKQMASRAGFKIVDEGGFNGTWFMLLERPSALDSIELPV